MIVFAQIDRNNIVKNVVSIDETRLEDYGIKKIRQLEEQRFWESRYATEQGDTWVKAKDGVQPLSGQYYVADKNKFIDPKPYKSWSLDADSGEWVAPIPEPNTSTKKLWSEDSKQWHEVSSKIFRWNEITGAWDEVDGLTD